VLDDLNSVDLLSDHSPVLLSVGAVSRGGRGRGGFLGGLLAGLTFLSFVRSLGIVPRGEDLTMVFSPLFLGLTEFS